MKIKNIDNLASGIITNTSSLNRARLLLYQSYIKELEWEITHDNPSNIKIEHIDDDQKILTDDFDDLSIWFSVSNTDDMIACGRVCREDKNGLLEIERYENATRILKPILDNKENFNIIELNREAILPQYSEQKELYGLILLRDIFEYCLSQNHTILTTSNIPYWVSIYDLISFSNLNNFTFKYFDSDPLSAFVYLAKPSDIKQLLRNIDFYFRKKGNLTFIRNHERLRENSIL